MMRLRRKCLFLDGDKTTQIYYFFWTQFEWILIRICSMLLSFHMRKVFIIFFFLFFLICSEFCHTLKWNGLGFTCLPHPDPPLTPPSPPTPSRSSQSTRYEHLSHASNLGWWSVSPLIISYIIPIASLEVTILCFKLVWFGCLFY